MVVVFYSSGARPNTNHGSSNVELRLKKKYFLRMGMGWSPSHGSRSLTKSIQSLRYGESYVEKVTLSRHSFS